MSNQEQFIDDITKYIDMFSVQKSMKNLKLTTEHVLKCVKDMELQENWTPKMGDIMVGSTGNFWVISGEHRLVPELGGTLYFFGGSLCSRDGSCEMKSTTCYTMNKSGKNWRGNDNTKDWYHSSQSNFRHITRVIA